jgi:cytochrome c oxidase subunit II
MNEVQFQFLPEQASTLAPRTDALYMFLWIVTGFFTLLIFVLVVGFALKYRRKSEKIPQQIEGSLRLELTWTFIPLIIVMIIFVWGARLTFFAFDPPPDAIPIHVIGKQWMWKLQHPDGQREINELHVPVGRPVKLVLSSQDVIHSFFIPAFRVKMDAIPGRYTTAWFEPTKPGVYHLFCAEYCGTEHSGMIGKVIVQTPQEYEAWLAGAVADEPPAQAGARLFNSFGCVTCHGSVAPTMAGLFGSQVHLEDGRTVPADELYLRESILNATDQVVAGYKPIMPSFRGQISEEQLVQLIAYIKSLRDERQQPSTAPVQAGRSQP